MARNYLSEKQRAVLDDLFGGELDEEQVLEKHNVSRAVYSKWYDRRLFRERFEQRLQGLVRQSELLIAKYGFLAAAKLVELVDSEKAETARKACLDVIKLSKQIGGLEGGEAGQGEVEVPVESLSQEEASELLSTLAARRGKARGRKRAN
jgi:hypothetical protein